MRVQLLRAWPHRAEHIDLELAVGACVGDALEAAGWRLEGEFVALAVFGQTATLHTRLHAGDRIELLRALQCDPKQARRRRAGSAAPRGRQRS
ncbi:RnfH family protein [Thermomonas fusca]|uniref:UPF0125 protein E5S66_07620 n=1 Tax=Thermomonas fusca TaxID=215690 RepID=A0A5R9PGN4_9GAMM|nr:RnfH family protein [Thermomonas fusca]TLX22366.1 RnfH family protein [Thermomonas fusca]